EQRHRGGRPLQGRRDVAGQLWLLRSLRLYLHMDHLPHGGACPILQVLVQRHEEATAAGVEGCREAVPREGAPNVEAAAWSPNLTRVEGQCDEDPTPLAGLHRSPEPLPAHAPPPDLLRPASTPGGTWRWKVLRMLARKYATGPALSQPAESGSPLAASSHCRRPRRSAPCRRRPGRPELQA